MNLIVAVSENLGIGNDGNLLFNCREDMQYFRQKTLGRAVIMGRKTLQSLPGQKGLPGRKNIVLSRSADFAAQDVSVCTRTELLPNMLTQEELQDAFVIGGEQIYRLLLPQCDTLYITHFHKTVEADTFFPDVTQHGFALKERSATHYHEDIPYEFCIYTTTK